MLSCHMHFRVRSLPGNHNADYARFIADDGYNPEHPWWTPQGRVFLQPGGHRYDDQEQFITLPRFWHSPSYNNPAQPVVAESRGTRAAAYCNWLIRRGHNEGWLPADAQLRLPASLEWERAARHTDKRRYPWGPNAPAARARQLRRTTQINTSSPIGCFPLGAAACNALDLAGSNVMEWMMTPADKPQQLMSQKDFTPDEEGVLLSKGCLLVRKRTIALRHSPLGLTRTTGMST